MASQLRRGTKPLLGLLVTYIPKPGNVIVALFMLNQASTTFSHCIAYVHQSRVKGRKMHATDFDAVALTYKDYWEYVDIAFDLVPDSTLAAAKVIGHTTVDYTEVRISKVLADIPVNEIPPVQGAEKPKFTCRVWLKEVVRVLNVSGIVDCKDPWDTLILTGMGRL